jgi:dTDP-4-amino-4,6-dideoxygalactose transaminase
LQPAFAHLGYKAGDFPQAERAAREVLSLPIYPELAEEKIDEVLQTIGAFSAEA